MRETTTAPDFDALLGRSADDVLEALGRLFPGATLQKGALLAAAGKAHDRRGPRPLPADEVFDWLLGVAVGEHVAPEVAHAHAQFERVKDDVGRILAERCGAAGWEVNDLLQQVWLRTQEWVRRGGKLTGEEHKAFFVRVGRNILIDHRRRPGMTFVALRDLPDPRSERGDNPAALNHALQELPPEQARAVRLRAEGRTFSQMGQALGCSAATAHRLLARACVALQELMS
jgi:RNA polymerase sigma factor (sigma-70 family)